MQVELSGVIVLAGAQPLVRIGGAELDLADDIQRRGIAAIGSVRRGSDYISQTGIGRRGLSAAACGPSISASAARGPDLPEALDDAARPRHADVGHRQTEGHAARRIACRDRYIQNAGRLCAAIFAGAVVDAGTQAEAVIGLRQ